MQQILFVVIGLMASLSFAKPGLQEEPGIEILAEYKDAILLHPCAHVECDVGKECVLDKDDRAICVCYEKCPSKGSNIAVCSTLNETFGSECDFHRERCLCQQGDDECKNPAHVSAMMDYYGSCKEMPPCEAEEMEEYPHRMRDWIFYVMEELDERALLTAAAHNLLQKSKNEERRWVLPVIWKFCELDKTDDRFVTPEELLPISAPLKALEHCTGPFLELCDVDENGQIDIIEWGTCLKLDPEEIEDRCDALK